MAASDEREIIEQLEALLEMAREGQVDGLMLAVETTDHWVLDNIGSTNINQEKALEAISRLEALCFFL